MGDASELRSGIRLSISEIAAEFAMSRNTVSTRIKDRGIRPDGKKGGYPVYRLRDLLPMLQNDEEGPAGGRPNPDKMKPMDRRAHYQAENERLKFEAECKQLIPAAEVHEQFAAIAKLVKRTLITLPDQVERDKRCPPEIVVYLDKKMREVLDELANKLASDDMDEGDVRDGA